MCELLDKTAVFVWCNQVVSKFAVFLMVYMIHIVSSLLKFLHKFLQFAFKYFIV